MGPLGLSGSLFLGLLVFDFYHPTNRDLYLVGGGGGGVFLGEISIFSKLSWTCLRSVWALFVTLKVHLGIYFSARRFGRI